WRAGSWAGGGVGGWWWGARGGGGRPARVWGWWLVGVRRRPGGGGVPAAGQKVGAAVRSAGVRPGESSRTRKLGGREACAAEARTERAASGVLTGTTMPSSGVSARRAAAVLCGVAPRVAGAGARMARRGGWSGPGGRVWGGSGPRRQLLPRGREAVVRRVKWTGSMASGAASGGAGFGISLFQRAMALRARAWATGIS